MNTIKTIILLAIILVSCDTKDNNKTKEITETPPSIQQGDEKKHNQNIIIDEATSKMLNIEHMRVVSKIVEFELIAPGTVEPAPDNIAYVAAPISGRIVSIYAKQGQFVRKGELLLEIESLEYGSMISDLLQAKSELDYQANQLERINKLTEKKISSASELEKTKSEFSKADAYFKAASSRLMAIGVDQKQIDNIINNKDVDPHLKIYSPISGSIDKYLVDLGKAVNSLENLITIIDVSQVLVRGYLSPEEANFVSVGNKVCIMRGLSQNKICDVPINSINPALDEENKSLVLNILTKTQNNFPKPGLNVRLQIKASTMRPMIKVPVSAISYEENEPTVFVRLENNKYEKRYINIYKTLEKYAIISSGLNEGDEIATSQIFSLKALGRFEQFAE